MRSTPCPTAVSPSVPAALVTNHSAALAVAGPLPPGKAALHAALGAVLTRFAQGVCAIMAGNVPSSQEYECLARDARRVLQPLAGRLRQLDILPDAVRAPLPGKDEQQAGILHGKTALCAEHTFCRNSLMRMDAALAQAMADMETLCARNDWPAADALARWGLALHAQTGAMLAALAARALMDAGHQEQARRLLHLLQAPAMRRGMSRHVRAMANAQGVSATHFQRRDLPAPALRHEVRVLAVGPDGQLLAGGFSSDLSTGGLSLLDPWTGASRQLLQDAVITGLCHHPASGCFLATAFKSPLCAESHLLTLNTEGEVLQVLPLSSLGMGLVQPHFPKAVGHTLFVRDLVNAVLLEFDPRTLQMVGSHAPPGLRQCIGLSAFRGGLLLHPKGMHGWRRYDPATQAMEDVSLPQAGPVYSVQEQPGGGVSLGVAYAFHGTYAWQSRLTSLTAFDHALRVTACTSLPTGICVDMAVCVRGRQLLVLVTGTPSAVRATGLYAFALEQHA